MPPISPNTQASLLLTAPLILGRAPVCRDLLSPSEFKRLSRRLSDLHCHPEHLISSNASALIQACNDVIDAARLQRLLERGFLLSQAVERWHARAIWVVGSADPDYPQRLTTRLREDAPPVLYGCGDIGLVSTGGLAVVGSRFADDVLIDFAMSVGRLAARASRTLISGGARGVDQAAMRGSLAAGGRVCGVLADSLEKMAMNRDHRDVLLHGQLVLISPYDPSAGFNVGNAMQRNKVIYALSDASLIVSCDYNKGGTWAGAVEQLDKLRFVPVFVRSTGRGSAGLDGLQRKGAIPWPNPKEPHQLEDILANLQSNTPTSRHADTVQAHGPLGINSDPPIVTQHIGALSNNTQSASVIAGPPPISPSSADREPDSDRTQEAATSPEEGQELRSGQGLGTMDSVAVRNNIRGLLTLPMSASEVASALGISKTCARNLLEQMVKEVELEKLKRPVRYVLSTQPSLFEE